MEFNFFLDQKSLITIMFVRKRYQNIIIDSLKKIYATTIQICFFYILRLQKHNTKTQKIKI